MDTLTTITNTAIIPVLLILWTFVISVLSAGTITFSVVEERPIGTFVGNLKTSADLDPAILNVVTFTILPPDGDAFHAGQFFQVESSTGILTLYSVIDRDNISHCAYKNTCQLTFEIAVGPAQYFQVITVNVDVRDINDNSPVFSKAEYNLNISESAFPETVYSLPSVSDRDSEDYGIQRFEIKQNNGLFNITWSRDLQGRVNPKLVLRQSLDREVLHTFDFSVIAYDSGSPPNSDELLIHLVVQDINDNDPEFAFPEYEAWMFENSPIGTSLITVHAEDPDLGSSGHIKYSLAAQSFSQGVNKFTIDPDTGVIYLLEEVDREERSLYYFSVTATDQAKDQRQATTTVKVHVDDVNDNAPVIRVNVITPSGRPEVEESTEIGTFVALVSVSDRDEGSNAQVNCRLNSNRFVIQNMDSDNKFKIVTNSYLDREERQNYDLKVTCEDNGNPRMVSEKMMSIFITDLNDHAPVFSQQIYKTYMDENNHIGVSVLTLECVDEDIGDNADITFSLLDNDEGHFMIESKTGILRASSRFDYETLKETRVTVKAEDAGNPPLYSTCIVEVEIQDVNDQPPMFGENDYTFIVRENQIDFSQVGSVSAYDRDTASNGRFWYSLTSQTEGGQDSFFISRDNGTISLLRPLDREYQPFYHMIVTATNYEPPELSATASVTVYIQDVNDNAPVVDFPSSVNNSVHISSHLPPGYKVTQIRAHDQDAGENGDLSFFLTEDTNAQQTFGVDPKSGEVFLNHDLSDVKAEAFHLRVLVKDNGVPELSTIANFTVLVNESLTVPLVPVGKMPDTLGHHNDRNMTIIIVVVAISGVIIIVLLVAIVFVLLTSKRKRRRRQNGTMATTVVMDNLGNNGNQDNTHDQERSEVTIETEKKLADEGEEAPRYVPLAIKPFYNNMNNSAAIERRSPVPPAVGILPRGLYVSYQARGPDLSFVSEESEQTKQELQAITDHSPCQAGPARPLAASPPADGDRDSATSADDSVTDSGRGASEEGDPTSGDEHGHPRLRSCFPGPSTSPPPIPPKSELLLAPNYGLKHLQTRFDPHYRIKYNNLDTNTPSYCDIPKPSTLNIPTQDPLNTYKQTVRTVKAKDKTKRLEPLSGALCNSTVMQRYTPECSDMSSYYNPALYNLGDISSLMNYKARSSSSGQSEATDATSEASATSGTYIVEHDDETKPAVSLPSVITASRC